MWPFKRKKAVNLDDLQALVDSLHGMVGALEEETDRALDHLTWRLECFMRFHEEAHGLIADASWGPPPLISAGSPLDMLDIPPPPEGPDAAEGE